MQNTLKVKKRGFVWEMKHNHTLYLMCVPGLLLLLAFAYVPMFGIRKNTLIINAWGLVLGTALPITIAICMNEVRNGVFKKVSQSAMFFPYFLSWVVVGAILYGFLTSNFRVDRKTGELIVTGANGIVNRIIMAFGGTPVRWYAEAKYWKTIIILLDVWKWAGYNSIIYISAGSSTATWAWSGAWSDRTRRCWTP